MRGRLECVVHLAAEIASQRSERKIREVNAQGTARLVDGCLVLAGAQPAAGPRLVFASTVVTGDAHRRAGRARKYLPRRR